MTDIVATFWRESKIYFFSAVTWLILLTLFAGPALAVGKIGADSFYSRGEALVKQGRVAAAIKEFERAVQLNPANTGMRTRLAWLLLDQNQPASALSQFERLVSQRPQDKTAISGMAICYLKLGQPERAVVVLNRGLQGLPMDTLLLKLKGEALSSRRETAGEAVKVYDELLKMEPGKVEWTKARQTAARLAASNSYYEAQAYLKKGDRAAALRAFKSALEYEPEAIGYRTHYGWVLLEDGQVIEAIQAFQEVLRLDPNKKDAYLGLALAQLRHGKPAEALKTTGRGLELFPDEVQLLEVQAGAARARPETLPLAVETYQRLLALRPGDAQVDLKLAQIMLEQGRTNEAERKFQQVLRQDPGNYEANLALARLDLRNDAYGLALSHFEKASAAAPESQEAAKGLGRVQELMRPQLQSHAGALEDSDSFRRSYIYSSLQYYLTHDLRGTIGYGYLNYTMGNDPLRGRINEHSVHRHILPVDFNYRPCRQLVLELGGAASDYGVWGQSLSGRVGLYYQATDSLGLALSYAYYDVIDYYGPFKGPWGRHVDEFADMDRYRYLVIDPTGMWAQNIFGASSTQAVTNHIRAQEPAFWGYKTFFSRLTVSAYGSISPYNDDNLRKSLGTTFSYLTWMEPLLKLKYSFFYLGFRRHSADLADLPSGSAPLYWDPIGFKNHSWGVVFEKNWAGRFKLALEGDMLYTPGAPSTGSLVFLEADVLLTKNLAWRTIGFYLNSVDRDKTSYQVRNVSTGLSFRF